MDTIEIPVTYKGQDLVFNASLKTYGFVHKIEVDFKDQTIIFEQDEEGLYRAVVPYVEIGAAENSDTQLLGLIASVLNNP